MGKLLDLTNSQSTIQVFDAVDIGLLTLPSSPNTISFSQVNVELGRPATQQLTMGNSADTAMRALFGKPTQGTAISMSDGWGKTYGYSIEILIVGGGGSGGTGGFDNTAGGGGGAGAVLTGSVFLIPGTGYSIAVGSGGPVPGSNSSGNNGGNSSFDVYIANGGGGGGSGGNGGAGQPGKAGGCGGGGGGRNGAAGGATNQVGYSGFTAYGFAGGSSISGVSSGQDAGGSGGGGTGPGAAGYTVNGQNGTSGGDAPRALLFQGNYYAGGGGGGSEGGYTGWGGWTTSNSVIIGGEGSGARSDLRAINNAPATNGVANTGSGGGGGGSSGGVAAGGGGSGTVRFRYAGAARHTSTGNYTVSNDGTYTYIVCNTVGTFSFIA